MAALPLLMVALGVIWLVIVSWRMRTPTPRGSTGRLRHPAPAARAATPYRSAWNAPTPLADEVEDWLRQR